MDMNSVSYLIIGAGLIFLLVWGLFAAMTPDKWRCQACDFETYNEAEALGHVAQHGMHKMVKQ